MVFSHLIFIYAFLPLLLILYYCRQNNSWRRGVLLAFSLVFYAWGEPVYIVLMLFSSIVDYTAGRTIERAKGQRARKAALIVSLCVNIGLLGVFKYADMFIAGVNGAGFGIVSLLDKWFPALGAVWTDVPALNLALPVGISFYTFQTMSYTIDVYRGNVEPEHNFLTFGAYVSMFPQLVAGPIVRYSDVARELNSRTLTVGKFSYGVKRFAIGLAKKALLADSFGAIFAVLDTPGSTLGAWLGAIAYGLQIYFDFSGYSDMAIGMGSMLGFSFPENFDHPYTAKSITEFWRRWHMTLSSWFKEYVYFSLGGSRKGLARQLLNIAIVWALTGLWHGAAVNFLLWGLYFAVLLAIEKLFLLKALKKAPAIVAHAYTLIALVFGWVIFAFDDFTLLGNFFKAMFAAPLWDNTAIYTLLGAIPILIVGIIGSTPLPKRLYGKLEGTKAAPYVTVVLIALALVASTAYLVSGGYSPFLYFRF